MEDVAAISHHHPHYSSESSLFLRIAHASCVMAIASTGPRRRDRKPSSCTMSSAMIWLSDKIDPLAVGPCARYGISKDGCTAQRHLHSEGVHVAHGSGSVTEVSEL